MAEYYVQIDSSSDVPTWDNDPFPLSPFTHILRIVNATDAPFWDTGAIGAGESMLAIDSATDVLYWTT